MLENNGANYLAKFLKNYGVSHVFYVLAILRKSLSYMEKQGIKRITAHSEKAAVYMADGYARISHKPGIAMSQSVGAANLAAGLQDPFLAHSPVIAITGRKPFIAQYRNAYQEIKHEPMFDPVTKYNVNIDTGLQLPLLLRQAFREATSGAPRPVHLDLLGFAGENIENEIISDDLDVELEYTKFPSYRPVPEDKEFEKAVDLIKKANKPVIVYGIGAVASSAGEEILKLSELLSIPVAYSVNGKGLLPDTYSLNAGSVGTYSCLSANEIVSEADLVIYIGCGVGDQVTMNWTIPSDEVIKIQIDIDPSELGRNYKNTTGLLGDAKKTVAKLVQLLRKVEKKSEWADIALNIINTWKKKIEPLRNSDQKPIRPERLCKEISDTIPDDAIVVADTGYSAMWASSMIEFKSIEQTFIRAAGSLGWAFPASLGAKCAAPDRPVICFTGDGGFWYHFAELETAIRWNINTITIINNNSAFGQSIVGIENAYEERKGNSEELYAFKKTNFANIANEMGCLGIRVEKPEDISSAIKQALDSPLPVVIDVISDRLSKPVTC